MPYETGKQTNRAALAVYLSSLHWNAFFTATFASHQRYSGTAMSRVVRALCQGVRMHPTKMFVAAEQHRLGGWHCHGLLEFPIFHEPHPFNGFTRNALTRLGYTVVGSVGNLDACSTYLSKYLTKDDFHGDWIMTGRKKFWRPVDK